jgi:hypothetical protein
VAIYSIYGIFVISKEAILNAGAFSFSKNSTAVISKGDQKISYSSAPLNNFSFHSHRGYASC